MMHEPTEGSMGGEDGSSPTDPYTEELIQEAYGRLMEYLGSRFLLLGTPPTSTEPTGSDLLAKWTGPASGVYCGAPGQSRRLLSFATHLHPGLEN